MMPRMYAPPAAPTRRITGSVSWWRLGSGAFAWQAAWVAKDASGTELQRWTAFPVAFSGGSAGYSLDVPLATATLSLKFPYVLRRRLSLPGGAGPAVVDYEVYCGDMNESGAINAQDILLERFTIMFDFDGDGTYTEADADIVSHYSLATGDPE